MGKVHRPVFETEDSYPQEEDYTLSPTGNLGCETAVAVVGGRFLGTFPTDDAALRFVRDRMNREGYWPNVWMISDHGNAEIVNDLPTVS